MKGAGGGGKNGGKRGGPWEVNGDARVGVNRAECRKRKRKKLPRPVTTPSYIQ